MGMTMVHHHSGLTGTAPSIVRGALSCAGARRRGRLRTRRRRRRGDDPRALLPRSKLLVVLTETKKLL